MGWLPGSYVKAYLPASREKDLPKVVGAADLPGINPFTKKASVSIVVPKEAAPCNRSQIYPGLIEETVYFLQKHY